MEIVNYDEQPQGSYALAIFDIYIPNWKGLILRRWKVCRSKQGHTFVQAPSFKKGEFEGKAQWSPYVDFTGGDNSKDFNKAVLDLLKPFVEGKKDSHADDAPPF